MRFSALRDGWTSPTAAIATRLLLWRPPGDRKRSHPVASGARASPVSTKGTGSAGFQQTPSTRPDASSKPGLVAQQVQTFSHIRGCAGILLVERFAHSRREEDNGEVGGGSSVRVVKPRREARLAEPTRTCTALTAASLLLRVYHFSSYQSIPFMRKIRQKERSLAQVGHGILQTSPTSDEALALVVRSIAISAGLTQGVDHALGMDLTVDRRSTSLILCASPLLTPSVSECTGRWHTPLVGSSSVPSTHCEQG